jgi:hypothetical protein
VALSSASWSALFHGRRLIYTLLVTLSVGMHAIGTHMLATVLPSIVADLGGAAFYAWATLLYTITSIIGTVCGGLVTARLGPLVMVSGGVGLAASIAHGPLPLLGLCVSLIGAGIGVCFAYISSWSIAVARSGESVLTASSIPTVQSLGIAFGGRACRSSGKHRRPGHRPLTPHGRRRGDPGLPTGPHRSSRPRCPGVASGMAPAGAAAWHRETECPSRVLTEY